MADTISQTISQEPANWEEFPGFERFWNAFVETFWGEGGNTSYHDMLAEDQEWLRQAYLQNNETMTSLEQNYLNSVQGTSQKYETGLRGSAVPISFDGQQLMDFVPRSAQRVEDAVKTSENELSAMSLLSGRDQAGRILDYATKFAPNIPNVAYMDYLAQLGGQGQTARAGSPTTTGTARIPSASTASQITSGLGVVQGGLGLAQGVADLFKPQPSFTGTTDTIQGSGTTTDWLRNPSNQGSEITQGPSSWDQIAGAGEDFWGWLTGLFK